MSKIKVSNNGFSTKEDLEQDEAFRKAVEDSIKKTLAAGNPVVRYNQELKKAYFEYPNGEIEYVY